MSKMNIEDFKCPDCGAWLDEDDVCPDCEKELNSKKKKETLDRRLGYGFEQLGRRGVHRERPED